MHPELNNFQKKMDVCLQEFHHLLREYAQLRRNHPQLRAEGSKIMERYLIRLSQIIRQVSQEYNDDLMQGISLLKIKMMQ